MDNILIFPIPKNIFADRYLMIIGNQTIKNIGVNICFCNWLFIDPN